MQGSYIDIHDNEVVNLSVDKGEVHLGDDVAREEAPGVGSVEGCESDGRASEGRASDEDLFRFVHPSVVGEGEWQIHNEVKHLVARQGIQEICGYMKKMADEKKILLPQSPSVAYAELVRMGMPSSKGFNEKTFQKYYRRG